MSHEVCPMGERAEKTNVEVIAPLLWLKWPVFANVAVPTIVRTGMDTFRNLSCRHIVRTYRLCSKKILSEYLRDLTEACQHPMLSVGEDQEEDQR